VETTKTIGFIGPGKIGLPICTNLVKAGYRAVKSVLSNLVNVLDPSTAGGKRIQGAIKDLGDTMGQFLGPLTGKEGKENMESFMLSFIDLLKQIVPLMERVATVTKSVFQYGAGKGDLGKDATSLWNSVLNQFGVHGMPTLPPVKSADELDRRYGPAPAPSVTMQTTVHVHGDAHTDNLVEKINTAQKQSFYEWLEEASLLSGSPPALGPVGQ